MATDRDRLIDDGLDILREVTVPAGDWDAYRKGNPAEPRKRRTVLGVIGNVKAKLARITIDLAEQASRRVPTLAGWGKDFLRLIGAGHVAGAMAGIGTTQPAPADMDVVERNVRGQSKFFRGFRQAIMTGALLLPPSPGTLASRTPGVAVATSVLSRAEMYADAIWGGTAGVLRSRMIRDGFDEERRVLGGIENACPECPPLTREGTAIVGGRSIVVGPDGWTPIGELPGIGETICRVRCRCHFEYRHAKSSTVVVPINVKPKPGNLQTDEIDEKAKIAAIAAKKAEADEQARIAAKAKADAAKSAAAKAERDRLKAEADRIAAEKAAKQARIVAEKARQDAEKARAEARKQAAQEKARLKAEAERKAAEQAKMEAARKDAEESARREEARKKPTDPYSRIVAERIVAIRKEADESRAASIAADAEVTAAAKAAKAVRKNSGSAAEQKAAAERVSRAYEVLKETSARSASIKDRLRRYESYEENRGKIPNLLPPLPIAERMALYEEGDRKVAAIAALGSGNDKAMEAAALKFDLMDQLETISKRIAAKKRPSKTEVELLGRARMQLEALKTVADPREEIRAKVVELLKVSDPVRINLDAEAYRNLPDQIAPDATVRTHIERTSRFFDGTFARGDNYEIVIPIAQIPPDQEQRSYAEGGVISMGANAGESVVAHEVGHAIDHMTRLNGRQGGKTVVEFLNHRVGDEKPEALIDLFPNSSYGRNEIGCKDKFEELFGSERLAYYAGKKYDESETSEIFSMGLEELYNNPAGFAKKDPEYLKFILGYMDGSLR